MADVVAVDGDGAWMIRIESLVLQRDATSSSRRPAPASPSPPVLPGPIPSSFALADVTGDGRRERGYVQVIDDAVRVSTEKIVGIPMRFVQLVADAGAALPETDLQAAVSLANQAHRPRGRAVHPRVRGCRVRRGLARPTTKSTPASTAELARPRARHVQSRVRKGCGALATFSPAAISQRMKSSRGSALQSRRRDLLVYVAR